MIGIDSHGFRAEVYYRPVGDECEIFETCFRSQLPLLIKGPTGCGKTQFVSYMANKLGIKLIKVSCNEDTSATDLLGRFLIHASDTIWQDGPVTRAVREGAILYLDEIAEAREDIVVVLHSLTDHRRELSLDRTKEELHAKPTFMCVASFNPGYQRGLKELKPSTRQRFITLNFDFPPEEIEKEVIHKLTDLDSKYVGQLVSFARKVREQSELNLQETISTRLLVHAAKLIKKEIPARRACQLAIVQSLSDDAKITQGLIDLVNLSF